MPTSHPPKKPTSPSPPTPQPASVPRVPIGAERAQALEWVWSAMNGMRAGEIAITPELPYGIDQRLRRNGLTDEDRAALKKHARLVGIVLDDILALAGIEAGDG